MRSNRCVCKQLLIHVLDRFPRPLHGILQTADELMTFHPIHSSASVIILYISVYNSYNIVIIMSILCVFNVKQLQGMFSIDKSGFIPANSHCKL